MMLTRRGAIEVLTAGAALLLLAGCKVVATGDNTGQSPVFDATAYAEGMWDSQALPHFQSAARSIAEVLPAITADIAAAGATYGYRPATEGSPWTFVVSGSATVTAKNTQSRAGTLTVAVEGMPPGLEVAIQIGPVVRGSAVRDTLPFVSFKDFTNQLEFADVGKAFTALSMAATSGAAEAAAVGDIVDFVGVMSLNASSDRMLVTPVSLEVRK